MWPHHGADPHKPKPERFNTMTTIKTIIPATVAFKVQGIESNVDVSTGHADAIAAVFEYGLRRWMQDHINSLAKAARDNDESFDTADAIEARLAQFQSGDITSRRPAAPKNDLDDYRVAVVLDMFRAQPETDAAKAYAAIPSDDQKARRVFRMNIAAKNAAIIDPLAQSRMDADRAAREAFGEASLAV